jgi:hypothetical protein
MDLNELYEFQRRPSSFVVACVQYIIFVTWMFVKCTKWVC